mmetsp:Transcript_30869/g.87338  ORF Transcript_30869/g.87338 Transcript_30869/m.87338 type:complete len:203 (-) Transcript_30869:3366-3974(-)
MRHGHAGDGPSAGQDRQPYCCLPAVPQGRTVSDRGPGPGWQRDDGHQVCCEGAGAAGDSVHQPRGPSGGRPVSGAGNPSGRAVLLGAQPDSHCGGHSLLRRPQKLHPPTALPFPRGGTTRRAPCSHCVPLCGPLPHRCPRGSAHRHPIDCLRPQLHIGCDWSASNETNDKRPRENPGREIQEPEGFHAQPVWGRHSGGDDRT